MTRGGGGRGRSRFQSQHHLSRHSEFLHRFSFLSCSFESYTQHPDGLSLFFIIFQTVIMETTASSSPVGSEIFALLSLLVISLGVLLLLRHYLPLRTTPAYLLVPIFFALGLPASMILLVPIDLASSARDVEAGSRGIWLPERVLLVSWRITYWLTFTLTW